MTLDQLRSQSASDEASGDARRIMAGGYARHAADALAHGDWSAATDYLLKAIARRPDDYAPALALVERCRGGASASPAKAAASRANGRKGGRPRKQRPTE